MSALKGFVTHPVTVRICQLAIGVILGVAGLAKLGDLQSFAEQIHNFRLLPTAADHLAAMVLPWIEIAAAVALILGVRPRAGAVIATSLLFTFTVAVLAALARGLDVECGCFGTGDASRVGLVKLSQNVGMLLLAVASALRRG